MANNPPEAVYRFMVNDFKRAWRSISRHGATVGRGNYMLARQVVGMLEMVARLCRADQSGQALPALSDALNDVEHRYFVLLPGVCAVFEGEFELPHRHASADKGRELLACLFDTVRNGQAHQYQQIAVNLLDGVTFRFGVSGPSPNRRSTTWAEQDRSDHLAFYSDVGKKTVGIRLRTEVLFADIDRAVRMSGLLRRNLSFDYLRRPRNGRHYAFGSINLLAALRSAGFKEIAPPGYIKSL